MPSSTVDTTVSGPHQYDYYYYYFIYHLLIVSFFIYLSSVISFFSFKFTGLPDWLVHVSTLTVS